ncbi:unnamed protein product, partial [Closterium sp. NIES-53]
TSGLGLVLGGRRPVVLTGHADASWADDQATQRSSQGYTFSLGSGSVSWRSTRSSSVLGSSCEAEIYAGAMAAQELRWLTYLLIDLGEPPRSPPVLYVENKAMLALCREHRLEHKTKHIALRYFLARELQQRGQLCLAYVASEANTADIFTKAVPPACFALLCLTGLVTSCSPPLCLWGPFSASASCSPRQPTPLSTTHSLSAPPSDESLELSGPYPELVVCLMYLMTCTRPDLAYPLSLLARYVAPGRHRKVHWDAAKRVLRYLCNTSGMGLVLARQGPVVLTGHLDASWVDDSATQWSSQGYTFNLGSGSVSWWSTRSSSVLISSCEAEIYAGAMAAQELRWLTYLLTDLGEQPRSPLQRGQLRRAYVATRANTADIFTKALPPACFAFLDWSCHHLFSPTLPMGEAKRQKLGMSNPYVDRLAYLGYADDTSLVLKGKRQVWCVIKLLDDFGEKSGLWVKKDKSALLPLGKNLRRKLDKQSVLKWVLPNEAERIMGVWVSPSGDAALTWEVTLVRATSEFVKWQIHFLTTTERVAVVNGYVNPVLTFQAQLRKLGELSVRDPFAELGGLAARRIALLVSQPLGLCADLEEAALDIPDLQVFWAHASLMKEWRGKSVRLRRTCELFLESSFPSSIIVSSCWDVEQELLLFNRCLLLNRKWPAGKQKVAKHLRRAVMKDFITIDENGVRALKDKAALEREFGGTHGAKLAKRIFYAAPDDWEQLLLVRVTARTVLAVSKFVLRAGTSHGVWRIESVEEETLVCRAVSCFREILGGAGERLRTFLPHEVVPAMCYGGKPKQQSSWEEELGHPIGWQRMIGVRDSTVLPNRARDVMLRVHSKNLQVGERLHFMGAGVACPHSGEKETLDHGLFSCPRIQLVVKALLQARRMLNPRQKVESLGDLLFQREGTVSGFPEATITSIALHRI